MDFDFRTFSTRSFERFAQAMALHVLGKGVLVFGDGPDGAREATYEGTLDYPSETDKWSGYAVMQAKFRQVPGPPQEDADWLVTQLSAELEKFAVMRSVLRKPEFYILVSNARLSPTPSGKRGQGGIAKIDAVFAKYKSKIGIKDYRVWHHDQLATMLMGAGEIRRSYAAWLSTSDVIAEMLDSMHTKSAAVRDAMYRYLTRELRAHQPLRLQQAGHSSDAQIMIEDVFIDLPYRLADQQEDELSSDKLLLSTLLERSRDCLDGASIKAQQERDAGRPERILLLGGPGQGKSTLSQFLAQIFRANVLRMERPGEYPAEISRIIESTLSKAMSQGLGIDVPRRFPLRVDLPNFADWLSGDGDSGARSLLHYLAHQITNIANAAVVVEDLRNWISTYPAILILDGLDEVPPSGNRSSVLRAINEFWDEATRADLLMVVTTRPQGYNDELDPNYYSKLEMTSLPPEQALAYAEKLAFARIVDRIQCDRVIARITEAAKSKTTSRLMVSPLQVAILLALIDQRGDAPTDRWSLFDKYFAVVLQREQAKAGPIGQTMRHWGRQISAIHYKAGFLLHVEAETKGNSEAYLSAGELESLIHGQLSDEEFEGDELQKITAELLGASTERLVLIVQREEERFSFEVRSLQEFMAAAYLMTGRESVVQERLRSISNRAHWLHVFQIAASKCFSVNDSEQYRDTIVTVCREINENGEEIDRLLRTGSRLALALLDDGLAYDQPKYRRLLLSTAFDLLLAGPSLLPESLCEHCEQEPTRTTEHLRRYLSSTSNAPVQATWKLILRCSSKNQSWTEKLLTEIWPEAPEKACEFFSFGIEFSSSSALHARMRNALKNGSPVRIYRHLLHNMGIDGRRRQENEVILRNYPCLTLLSYIDAEKMDIDVKLNGRVVPLSGRLTSLQLTKRQQSAYDDLPDTPSWAPMRALRDFHKDPSARALADLLDRIANKDWMESFTTTMSHLPWPLATLVSLGDNGSEIGLIAGEVRAGVYGDIADWRRAETRWNTKGIVDADIEHFALGKVFDADIANVGFPFGGYAISHSRNGTKWLDQLLTYSLEAKGPSRRQLSRMLAFVLTLHSPAKTMPLEAALFLVEEHNGSTKTDGIWAETFLNLPQTLFNETTFLKQLDKIGRSGDIYLSNKISKVPRSFYQKLISNLDRFPGLLVLVANFLATEGTNISSLLTDKIELTTLLQSEIPMVSSYAKVISLFARTADEKIVETILKEAVDEQESRANALLRRFLNNENLETERGRMIVEAIACVLNRNPMLPQRYFVSQIQTFANRRQAELRLPANWRRLELGESLLTLTTRRQTHAALT